MACHHCSSVLAVTGIAIAAIPAAKIVFIISFFISISPFKDIFGFEINSNKFKISFFCNTSILC